MLIDIYMEGLDGIEKRRRVMSTLRENPPKSFGGVKVKSIGDYKASTVTSLYDNTVKSTGQPSSDVLYYTLENDDKILMYLRRCARETMLVVANYSAETVDLPIPDELKANTWRRILTNLDGTEPALNTGRKLTPYECEIYTLAR
jgi:phosphoglucomutase